MDIDEFLDKEVQATEKEDIEKDVASQETDEEDIEKASSIKLKKEEITEEPISNQSTLRIASIFFFASK